MRAGMQMGEGRLARNAKIAAIAPLLVVAVVLMLPALFLIYAGQFLGHLWHVARLRLSWPHGKFVLLAYTESAAWAPYIEGQLLPQVGEHCVAINRSREDWKRRFPRECSALSFWGHSGHYPIAVVLRPWGRVRVFRFHDSFRDFKHGRAASLDEQVGAFVACVRNTTNGPSP